MGRKPTLCSKVGSSRSSRRTANREASLIFYDEELAKYFGEIFDHDWNNLAIDSIDIQPGVEIALAGDVVPECYVKISAEEFLQTL